MAHLDRDVAAYVDGQLSPEATAAADAHVAVCSRCSAACAQQRLVKSRVSVGGVPGPPAELLASLSALPVTVRRETRLERLRRSPALGVAAVLMGASLVVAVLAFVAGSAEERMADPVDPAFASYVDDFHRGYGTTEGTMTMASLTELRDQGWSCLESLGTDLRLVDGRWLDRTAGVVSLTYTDGRDRLRLHEKVGTLDESVLEGFERRRVGDRTLWVRTGDPAVATWDADGKVFVAVTDLDAERLAAAVARLPEPREPRGTAGRVSDGLERMTSWATP